MLEYDKETVLKILKIEGFELDDLNLNKIKHVPMHQYRISTMEEPFLLVENLQVCVGLYAYSKNFGFAAHLNPVIIREDEFQCDKNKNIIYCNRIDDLFNAIINAKSKENIYIGISLGFNSVHKSYQLVDILDKSIDELISKLDIMGIEVIKLELQHNHIFMLDTVNGRIITPSNGNTKKLSRRKL